MTVHAQPDQLPSSPIQADVVVVPVRAVHLLQYLLLLHVVLTNRRYSIKDVIIVRREYVVVALDLMFRCLLAHVYYRVLVLTVNRSESGGWL